MNNLKTTEDARTFLLNHGENIVDTLGAEIDRIEQRLKVMNTSAKLSRHIRARFKTPKFQEANYLT